MGDVPYPMGDGRKGQVSPQYPLVDWGAWRCGSGGPRHVATEGEMGGLGRPKMRGNEVTRVKYCRYGFLNVTVFGFSAPGTRSATNYLS